ncbi:ComEC/Rec2 family competence protein [Aestuariibius sp. 2305UL40-4]|uniref:ComEC/Rec2 family competence protein n=1 Tax=Aestuariibius violaceus TaxID=3234132 RepID=UPI00345F1598
MPSLTAPLDALQAQRGHLFLWVPVAFGTGIGGYFGAGVEPGLAAYVGASALALLAVGLTWICGERWAPALVAVAVLLGGFVWAGARAHQVAEPVLGWRYYGPIEGRIVIIDRSQSDKTRLTLDGVVLSRVSPERTPARVRVSLHGEQGFITPEPGQRVMLTGHLSPPSGPVEPGGFDFQRMAWFDRLGAVGYTRTPVLESAPAVEGQAGLGIYRLRRAISDGVQDRIEGPAGGVAAAIMTGDRSGMDQATLEALRRSNLAHLLAISGLHMGLLTAFIFGLVRYGLALVPQVALSWPTKEIAAVAALVTGAGYLALSGGNVATERAFIMVAVMFAAVLVGRRAVTLRAVAIAAMIVLALRPEALLGPGFQMSFAATIALVVVFRAIRDVERSHVPRWLRPVGAVVLSSAVAGAATAPFSALHFNQIAHYGLIANLLTVPLMGVLVMPAAVLAACLAPFGLEGVGLWLMEIGLRWILFVAETVSGLDGAVGQVKTPMPVVLPILALGLLTIALWQGRGRWVGLGPALIAAFLWAETERPDLLVSESGGLIGVVTERGRALSRVRGDGFAARSWLENDGDGADQEAAHARAGFVVEGKRVVADLGGWRLMQVSGKVAAAGVQDCAGAMILVFNTELQRPDPCETFGPARLRETGALAIYKDGQAVRIVTAREQAGWRPWNTPGLRGPERLGWVNSFE